MKYLTKTSRFLSFGYTVIFIVTGEKKGSNSWPLDQWYLKQGPRINSISITWHHLINSHFYKLSPALSCKILCGCGWIPDTVFPKLSRKLSLWCTLLSENFKVCIIPCDCRNLTFLFRKEKQNIKKGLCTLEPFYLSCHYKFEASPGSIVSSRPDWSM